MLNLVQHSLVSSRSALVGVARSGMSDADFRARIEARLDRKVTPASISGLRYLAGNCDGSATYVALRTLLEELDERRGTGGNRVSSTRRRPGVRLRRMSCCTGRLPLAHRLTGRPPAPGSAGVTVQ